MFSSGIEKSKLAQLLSERKQEFIIFPTEKCNFRCTYCYEDFSIGRMSKDTILGTKALLENRAKELDHLYISWFGGEPLITKDIVLNISAHASNLAKAHHGLTYRAGMTTNGYKLTPSTFSELTSVGVVDYQISLDGSQEVHDRSRLRADGKGTFQTIWENLLAIRESPEEVSIMLRLHFDADTITKIDPLIEDIRREFLHDQRFTIFFKSIERLGGPNDANIKSLSLEEKQSALKKLKQKLYGENYIDNEDPPQICYASRPNSLTIRADGSIGKCTVALNDPRNNIGRLHSNGTLKINKERLTPWIRGIASLDPEALQCPLAGLPELTN